MTATLLPADPIGPPPDDARGPARCAICSSVDTMHRSGRCSRCGDWYLEVDAAALRPGDHVHDGLGWRRVDRVLVWHNVTAAGTDVLVWYVGDPDPDCYPPDLPVGVAAHHRPRERVA